MTTDNGRAFNEWLRAELKAKKMSQRQLAQRSGVDHSTISRLIRGDRMPSLGTATRLARGLREIRDGVNKDIEALRATGQVGSSLQAHVALTVGPQDHALLTSLGADLKFVFITSAIDLIAGDALSVGASASNATKCERCWHYREDVGADPAHPAICGRCTSNLFGAGEDRKFA